MLPTGEPQALLMAPVADMITISSVRLSWEDPGGVVNFYIVEYKLRIDDWANLDEVEMMLVNGTIRMTRVSVVVPLTRPRFGPGMTTVTRNRALQSHLRLF